MHHLTDSFYPSSIFSPAGPAVPSPVSSLHTSVALRLFIAGLPAARLLGSTANVWNAENSLAAEHLAMYQAHIYAQ